MTATVVKRAVDLKALVGTHLGWSPWLTVDQHRIQLFADASDDHQWIHLDPERAKDGPFGQTIAHGFLTLSLAPALLSEVLQVEEVGLVVNYGLNKVRFPAPVRSGSNVRMGVELVGIDEVTGGVQATMAVVFEVEGQTKPACVAEFVFRYFD